MTQDLYLKAATEDDMDAALLEAGVIDDEGNPVNDFLVDQIGPFTRDDVDYPDWHTNLRGDFDEDQLALLTPLTVEPTIPYRVWA
jgi:hypothetical protein